MKYFEINKTEIKDYVGIMDVAFATASSISFVNKHFVIITLKVPCIVGDCLYAKESDLLEVRKIPDFKK
jgi:hypothetical protein